MNKSKNAAAGPSRDFESRSTGGLLSQPMAGQTPPVSTKIDAGNLSAQIENNRVTLFNQATNQVLVQIDRHDVRAAADLLGAAADWHLY
jgi:hypothetical protein